MRVLENGDDVGLFHILGISFVNHEWLKISVREAMLKATNGLSGYMKLDQVPMRERSSESFAFLRIRWVEGRRIC